MGMQFVSADSLALLFPGDNMQHDQPDSERSLAEYKDWVDAMVSRPESLRKARQHAPGKTLKRKSLR